MVINKSCSIQLCTRGTILLIGLESKRWAQLKWLYFTCHTATKHQMSCSLCSMLMMMIYEQWLTVNKMAKLRWKMSSNRLNVKQASSMSCLRRINFNVNDDFSLQNLIWTKKNSSFSPLTIKTMMVMIKSLNYYK